MGSRSKRGRKRGGQRQTHSFQQTVAMHVAQQVQGAIEFEVTKMKVDIFRDLEHTLKTYSLKTQAIQEILLEALKKEPDELYARMLDIEDDVDGYEKVTRPVEMGDRIRVDAVDLRDKDETPRKMMINRCCVPMVGSGYEVNKEIETALIGMKVGETKAVLTSLKKGDDTTEEFSLNITVNRISEMKDDARRETAKKRAEKFARGEDPDVEEINASDEIEVPMDILATEGADGKKA